MVGALAWGCSTAQKKTPELSQLEGKKVALVEIQGEPTPRRMIEVALINQLIRTGSFLLIPKSEIEAARSAPHQNPMDSDAIARKAGADYALKARVLYFDADEHEGFSKEIIEDSQLALERGDGKTQRIYRVKSLDAHVQILLEFKNLKTQEVRTGIAETREQAQADEKDSAIHLPPKLQLLENLTQKAFHNFFDEYR